MNWSLRIVRVAGIDVYIHWTFVILIVWLVAMFWIQGQTIPMILRGLLLVMALFACVVLHEFGHALTAKRFGIRTRDITLLPIGGVARLERMPEDPWQELLVALAGPAVNVVIAAILAGVIWARGYVGEMAHFFDVRGDFVLQLMAANIVLVLFNMLPAFPMDGGRVLRALLAQGMDYVRATQIAASVGQIMALFFGFLGLMIMNPFIIFIALFVFLGAQQEAHLVQMRSLLRGVPVKQAMVTRFRVLEPHETMQAVIDELLAGAQQDFPVVDGEELVGILTRNQVMNALAEGKHESRVGEVMRASCFTVDYRDMLQDAFLRMQTEECTTVPVVSNGRLVGMLTLENIAEWMMIQSALRKMPEPADAMKT